MCEMEHIPIGADCTLTASDSWCQFCQHPIADGSKFDVTYEGHRTDCDVYHLFISKKPYFCAGCGLKFKNFKQPCNSGGIWEDAFSFVYLENEK